MKTCWSVRCSRCLAASALMLLSACDKPARNVRIEGNTIIYDTNRIPPSFFFGLPDAVWTGGAVWTTNPANGSITVTVTNGESWSWSPTANIHILP